MTARLNQHPGGDYIDTHTHRCSVLPPLTDDEHDARLRWAEQQRLAIEHANAPWKTCDLICACALVAVVVGLITKAI